jgi:LmbE family N-acetylglucosaminyl deacetylase
MNGILVLTAHPDDESLIAGGLLAACAATSMATSVLCLTRGESGPIADPALATPETLGAVREAELRAACAELGVSSVRCLDERDAYLPWVDGGVVCRQIARAIEAQRPAVIVTFGPDGLYDHPDHLAVCRLARRALALLGWEDRLQARPSLYEAVLLDSIMPALVRSMTERGLAADLWGIEPEAFGIRDPGDCIAVDVRPFVDCKLRALRRHRSQLGEGHVLTGVPEDLAQRFLGVERFRPTGPPTAGADALWRIVAPTRAELTGA